MLLYKGDSLIGTVHHKDLARYKEAGKIEFNLSGGYLMATDKYRSFNGSSNAYLDGGAAFRAQLSFNPINILSAGVYLERNTWGLASLNYGIAVNVRFLPFYFGADVEKLKIDDVTMYNITTNYNGSIAYSLHGGFYQKLYHRLYMKEEAGYRNYGYHYKQHYNGSMHFADHEDTIDAGALYALVGLSYCFL